MRGKVAKAIRRAVYDDTSLKVERQYVGGKIGRVSLGYSPGTIRNHPSTPRAIYQGIKANYKRLATRGV